MTIRKTIEEALVNHGLWPKEAANVVAELEADKASEPMWHRWDEDSSNYPPALLSVLLISAKSKAVEWLEKNAPKHFALAILKQ